MSRVNAEWRRLVDICNTKNKKERDQLLRIYSRNPEFCGAVRIIAKNCLKGNCRVPTAHINCKRDKVLITELAKKRNSKRRKQKLTQQSGGWLTAVLPLIATILGEVIREVQ